MRLWNADRLSKLADFYGLENRLSLLEEERAELIQAISKLRRAGSWPPPTDKGRQDYIAARMNLSEEMADVLNLTKQAQYLLNNGPMVEFWWEHKLERTLAGMQEADA